MTPEGRIEAYLKKQVEAAGGSIRKVRWIGRRNAPDRLAWIRAPGAWIEVKCSGEVPTPPQQREHERLRKDGWIVLVVDSYETVDSAVKFLTHL